MRIVMPRSRSRSIASRACSSRSRVATVRVISSNRSERVVLPWSICAMMQKLRTLLATSIRCGRSVLRGKMERLENRYAAIEDEMPERRPNEKLQGEKQNQKRQIESPHRWNGPADRDQNRLEDRRQVVDPASPAQTRKPRCDRIDEEQDRVNVDDPEQRLCQIANKQIHVRPVLRRRRASPLDCFEFLGRCLDRRLECRNGLAVGSRAVARIDARHHRAVALAIEQRQG